MHAHAYGHDTQCTQQALHITVSLRLLVWKSTSHPLHPRMSLKFKFLVPLCIAYSASSACPHASVGSCWLRAARRLPGQLGPWAVCIANSILHAYARPYCPSCLACIDKLDMWIGTCSFPYQQMLVRLPSMKLIPVRVVRGCTGRGMNTLTRMHAIDVEGVESLAVPCP
jgi:hypothetical protein